MSGGEIPYVSNTAKSKSNEDFLRLNPENQVPTGRVVFGVENAVCDLLPGGDQCGDVLPAWGQGSGSEAGEQI